jgi:hypothetical protein
MPNEERASIAYLRANQLLKEHYGGSISNPTNILLIFGNSETTISFQSATHVYCFDCGFPESNYRAFVAAVHQSSSIKVIIFSSGFLITKYGLKGFFLLSGSLETKLAGTTSRISQ